MMYQLDEPSIYKIVRKLIIYVKYKYYQRHINIPKFEFEFYNVVS